jgi:transcriptional regulator with XRE-family HTH domain
MAEERPQNEALSPLATIGERLRQARLRAGLTQGELGQGRFSKSYLSAVERGRIKPSLAALAELAETLHVSIAYLLGEGGELEVGPPSAEREASLIALRDAAMALAQAHYTEALTRLDALAEGAPLTERERIDRALLRGQALTALGEPGQLEEAVAVLRKAADQAHSQNDIRQEVRVRLALADALLARGNHVAALAEIETCQNAWERGSLHDPAIFIQLRRLTGSANLAAGNIEIAREAFAQVLAASASLVDLHTAAIVYEGLARCALAAGQPAQAIPHLQESIAALQMTSERNRRPELALRALLARVYHQLGQLHAARDALLAGLPLAESLQFPRELARLNVELASVLFSLNDLEGAAAAAERALQAAQRLAAPEAQELQGQASLIIARIAAARHDASMAEKAFNDALNLLSQTPDTAARADAQTQYATYLAAQGRFAEAYELMRRAYGEAMPRQAAGEGEDREARWRVG